MKLVTKTTIYYLTISCVILLIAGISSYFTIRTELADDELEIVRYEQSSIEKLIKAKKINGNSVISPDGLSKVEEISNIPPLEKYIADTSIWDHQEQEFIEYRSYISFLATNDKYFKITIAKNQHLKAEFFENVMVIIGLIFTLIVVVFLAMNWFISKVTWNPFYVTLTRLKNYSITDHKETHFEPSSVYEFNALNVALSEMTNAIHRSYQEQKEFTENASHEMQTPLAILKSNLEMLIQSENLDEKDMMYVEGIESGISKLTRLNSTLLLLAKIENNQFHSTKSLNVRSIIHQHLLQFEDEVEAKGIQVENNLPDDFQIRMDPNMAEILFGNLILNAIRHNEFNGMILFELKENTFVIKNSGNPVDFNPDDIFARFKKGSTSLTSTGLGLSIVKSIVNSYGFSIEYSYVDQLHIFNLKLPNE